MKRTSWYVITKMRRDFGPGGYVLLRFRRWNLCAGAAKSKACYSQNLKVQITFDRMSSDFNSTPILTPQSKFFRTSSRDFGPGGYVLLRFRRWNLCAGAAKSKACYLQNIKVQITFDRMSSDFNSTPILTPQSKFFRTSSLALKPWNHASIIHATNLQGHKRHNVQVYNASAGLDYAWNRERTYTSVLFSLL